MNAGIEVNRHRRMAWSGGGTPRAPNRLAVSPASSAQRQNSESDRVLARAVADRRAVGPAPCGAPSAPAPSRSAPASPVVASAGTMAHPFALDLHHARTAVAVRPVSRGVAVTEVGNKCADPLPPSRWSRRAPPRPLLSSRVKRTGSLIEALPRSSAAPSGPDSARLGRDRRWTRPAWLRSIPSSAPSHLGCSIRCNIFSQPTRQGVH